MTPAWYCMNKDQTLYLRKDGRLKDLCGLNGFWDTEEEVKTYIDSLTEVIDGFVQLPIPFIDEQEFTV
jgi:hypothetical protein